MKTRTFESQGVKIPRGATGDIKVVCPKCSDSRTKKDDPCLSVNVDRGVWKCHHCGWASALDPGEFYKESQFQWQTQIFEKPDYDPEEWRLSKKAIEWFKQRGISLAVLKANLVGSGEWRFGKGDYEPCVTFPFVKNGEIVQVQFRSLLDKRFKLMRGCEKPFYGLHHLVEDGRVATKKLIIVEGMLDKLALYEAGFKYVLSVPNGSPFESEGQAPTNPRLSFLDDPDFHKVSEYVEEIVLATDDDHQGRRLRDALAERVGSDRCKLVTWPQGCKDANDVLMHHGKEALVEAVVAAKDFPVYGIVRAADVKDKLLNLYKTGITPGMSVGLPNVNEIYTCKEGYLTVTTGVPEVGKSVIWDNFNVNMAREYDIHIPMFTPENRPVEQHISRLVSIYLKQSFGTPVDQERMTLRDLNRAFDWVDKHFSWIYPDKPTLENLLALFTREIQRKGSKVIVTDPFAAISQDRSMSEHQFIQELLSRYLEHADKYKVHHSIIAHPTKLELKAPTKKQAEDPDFVAEWAVPTAYNISGSSHWFNKSDFVLSIWRTRRRGLYPAQIHVQKSKVKQVARSKEYRLLAFDERTDMFEPYYGPADQPLNLEQEFETAYRQVERELDGGTTEEADAAPPRRRSRFLDRSK
jgi:twinkle protein